MNKLLIAGFISCFWGNAVAGQARLEQDIAANKPIVIQLSVALADNKNQWIVPVPAAIGNGQDAKHNLYWGARYGVKTYLQRDGGWKTVALPDPGDKRILERRVLHKLFNRNDKIIDVYLVADAWDGRFISDTIKQFLRYNGGHDNITVNANGTKIKAGGKAHLIAYIGHNALMDYGGAKAWLNETPVASHSNPDNDAIVLACKSGPYFSSQLEKLNAKPLLMTTGLMAPEAYSLDAAIKRWIAGDTDQNIRKAAAASYHAYQKTGVRAAQRLFGLP
ncbi:MAG: hypothetical protein OEZ68_09855 [Gammaproteobacteria bacterium]|nr:hypothetical protein [Gammaproteobacteria bacterium]MDH5801092.1 hypothetical protein [Gammaproteobacteria bacterium]